MMNEYTYEGAVIVYGRCDVAKWKASTRAISQEKAISNLKHQFRKMRNMAPYTKLVLPGKITISY